MFGLARQPLSRILRCLLAAAAVLAFLLHGNVMAAQHADAVAISDSAHAQWRAECPDCTHDISHTSRCDTACSTSLPPLGFQVAEIFSRKSDGFEAVPAKFGIDPEGVRRPPKTGA